MEAGGYAVELRRGILLVAPLWLGIVPFGMAFALLSRTEGFSILEMRGVDWSRSPLCPANGRVRVSGRTTKPLRKDCRRLSLGRQRLGG